MDPVRHIEIIRHKQQLIHPIAEEIADGIFKDIFQGDAVADQIDDLMVELYHPDEVWLEDDGEQYNQINADLTDAVWASILHRLHEKVRHTQQPNETFPMNPTLSDFPPR